MKREEVAKVKVEVEVNSYETCCNCENTHVLTGSGTDAATCVARTCGKSLKKQS